MLKASDLAFHLEGGFFWVAEAKLSTWAGFQDRRGGYGSLSSEGPSDGSVKIVFAPEGRDTAPLNRTELSMIDWLLENEPAMSAAVKAAILEEYPRLQETYDYAAEERAQFMPDIEKTDHLKPLIGLHSVNVHPLEKGGIPYFGFEFGCTWDTEHGLGVLMHGTRKVEVEGADTAILLWVAERDAERK